MQAYDVIVVGAGNGGISAACKLAKEGKKVLLLEKHNIPGGCASSFRRGRFEFEVALHELCDLGPENNPGDVRDILGDQYGLDIKWFEVPDTFRVIAKARSGRQIDIAMPSGVENFKAQLVKYVPDCKESLDNFFELAKETLAAISYISSSNGNPDSAVLKKQYPNFLRTAAYPTNKVLDALKMPTDAQDVINTYWTYLGVDTTRLAFMHYAAMVLKYVSRSAYIPDMTSHGLSLALIERFRAMGGEVWFNTRVDKVLFKGDHACGVSTAHGDIMANYVILNISPHIAYANMIPKELIPEREIKLCNARRHCARAFVLYLGLNKSAQELGIKDYSIFMTTVMDSAQVYKNLSKIETNNYSIALCYNVVNPGISPEGTCMMSFTTCYNEEVWGDIDIENYVETKNKIAKGMIEQFERETGIVIHDAIEEIEVATPWTFARYINSPQGTMYGYELTEWDGMMARLMMLSEDYPIKGLKFVGAHGPRGDGYNSTYICGEVIGRLTLKDMEAEGN